MVSGVRRFGLEASERWRNVGSVRTVAVTSVFSDGLLIRSQVRSVSAHDLEGPVAIVAADDSTRRGATADRSLLVPPPFLESEGWRESVVANPAAERVREIDGAHARVARSDRSRRSGHAVSGKDRRLYSATSRGRATCRTSRAAIAPVGRLHHGSLPAEKTGPRPATTWILGRHLRQLSQNLPECWQTPAPEKDRLRATPHLCLALQF